MPKKQLSVALDPETINRVRATVLGLKRMGMVDVSIAGAVGRGLTAWCAQMETDHNHGQPFSPTSLPLPPGRPIGPDS